MTPHLAEIIAAMVTAKLDAEADAGATARGTIASRPARAHHPQVPPAGRPRARR